MSRWPHPDIGLMIVMGLSMVMSGCSNQQLAGQPPHRAPWHANAPAVSPPMTEADTRADEAFREAVRHAISGALGAAPDAWYFTVDEVVPSPTQAEMVYFQATKHLTSFAGEDRGSKAVAGTFNWRTGKLTRDDGDNQE